MDTIEEYEQLDEDGNIIYEGIEKKIIDKIKAFNEVYEYAGFWTPAHIILQDYNIEKGYCVWAIEEIKAGRGMVWQDEYGVMTQEEVDALIVLLKEIVAIWDGEKDSE